jgi:hypothetical protein
MACTRWAALEKSTPCFISAATSACRSWASASRGLSQPLPLGSNLSAWRRGAVSSAQGLGRPLCGWGHASSRPCLGTSPLPLQVGRTSPADILLPIPTVSTRHALLRVGGRPPRPAPRPQAAAASPAATPGLPPVRLSIRCKQYPSPLVITGAVTLAKITQPRTQTTHARQRMTACL